MLSLPAYVSERRITRVRWQADRDIYDVGYRCSVDIQQNDNQWVCGVAFSFGSPPERMRSDYRTFVQHHGLVEYNTIPRTLWEVDACLRRAGTNGHSRTSPFSELRRGPWEYMSREPLPKWRYRARQSGRRMSDEAMLRLVRGIAQSSPFEGSGSLTLDYHR